jgi:hypothetical protein
MFDVEGSVDRAIVVALNAGETPVRIDFQLPEPAGGTANQVSWPGCGWGTTFASRSLGRGTLEVELEAREGVAIEVSAL